MNGNAALIDPSAQLKDAYLEFIDEFQTNREYPLQPYVLQYNAHDFPALINKLQDESRGIGLPSGWVPASTFWLVQNRERLLGVANLRHRLTSFLEHEGGHIGYGTLMLKLILDKARALGLKEVLVTCDKGNTPSSKIIESNRGVLTSEVMSETGHNAVLRYWITL